MENIRDLIAEQIFFSSSKTLDVDMLDNHLQSQLFYSDYFHISIMQYMNINTFSLVAFLYLNAHILHV